MEHKNKKGEDGLVELLYFFILLLLIIFLLISIYSGYVLYKSITEEPENLNVTFDSSNINSSQMTGSVKQFNTNMKFNHNNISYRLFDCSYDQEERILKAFEILTNETKLITFVKSIEYADIEILCSENNKQTQTLGSEYFIAGEGGPKEIIQTSKYNIITSGSVLLYLSPHKSLKCTNPTVEIHELLHVFGFDHSTNENSLMYPYLTSCNQKLDLSIIEELKRLYSIENLPDLYFSEFSEPIKKGRYLNLNFTIKNSGTINAIQTDFSIIEDGEISEKHNLGNIKFGAGISMKMENIRLKSTDPKQISIIIDYENKIKELDKENNIAKIKF